MADMYGFKVDTREMERAMSDLSRESDLADYESLTANARTMLKATVYNTPRRTGNGRAGWWPAWQELGMAGSPGTRVAVGRHTGGAKWKGQVYIADGAVVDQRKASPTASFEFINRSAVIRSGKPYRYLYALDARQHFMQKAADEAARKFQWRHEKLLRKHSAR
jgi:hypothetical protein